MRRWTLLAVLAMAIFGAAIIDVLFSDVIPIRPYDQFFAQASFKFSESTMSGIAAHSSTILLFVAIIIVAIMFPKLATTAPFLIGQHGKSEISHTHKQRLTKRQIAKKILKGLNKGNTS